MLPALLCPRPRLQVLVGLRALDARLLQLRKEQARIRGYHGHFVDTTMWIQGVAFRSETESLRTFLREEIGRLLVTREGIAAELEEHREAILECSIRFEKAKCEGDKLTVALKILHKTYVAATKFTMQQLLKQTLQEQAEQRAAAEAQAKQEEEDRLAVERGAQTRADRVRKKNYEHRTKEERQFLALDMTLRPELYTDVPLMEAEQMQFDEDYHTDLNADDLARIERQDPCISVALPFLRSREEVPSPSPPPHISLRGNQMIPV